MYPSYSLNNLLLSQCPPSSPPGDMAGSGAAMDPLFWVVHGAVERIFQRVMLEGVFTGS